MKKLFSLLSFVILFLLSSPLSLSQIVTGKLVDENGFGLADINLELFISSNVYNTTSLSDGSFYFTGVTGVKDDGELPSGYSITNNFPNPFNPTTRLGVTLPGDGNVRVNVYNILGQKVTESIQKYFTAGTHFLDLELYGLPSGIYIAQISIDDKYTVNKKMMLVYGSQHLTGTGGTINSPLNKPNLYKSNLSQNIDSLVATSLIIGRKTFTDLQSLSGDTTNLGELTIERFCPGLPTVTYEGKTYHTVLIGDQCWIKENLDVGTMILGAQEQTDNGIIEKYCYADDPNNCDTYGGLYQWNEAIQYVTNEGMQGICPPGWHIPTYEELQTLKSTVDNDGNSLKEIGQDSISTNISGFSALFAGGRNGNGSFSGLGYGTDFWSTTEYILVYAYTLKLIDVNSNIYLELFGMDLGFCVRCLKD